MGRKAEGQEWHEWHDEHAWAFIATLRSHNPDAKEQAIITEAEQEMREEWESRLDPNAPHQYFLLYEQQNSWREMVMRGVGDVAYATREAAQAAANTYQRRLTMVDPTESVRVVASQSLEDAKARRFYGE